MKIRNYVAKHARKFNKAKVHRNRKKFYKKTKHKGLTNDERCASMTQQPTKGES